MILDIPAKLACWISTYKNFWKIPLAKIILGREYVLRLRNGRKFIVREERKDRTVLDEYYREDGYEYLDLENFDTVVDVGAHIGVFSVESSDVVERVYSLEANPDTYGLLEKNLSLNDSQNVEAYNMALTGDGSTVNVSESDCSLSDNIIDSSEGLKVDSWSLSDLQNNICLNGKLLLKLDCEGAEYDIILKSDNNTLQNFDTIFLEWHREFGNPDDLVSKFDSAGFSVRRIADPQGRERYGFIKADF